MFSEILTAAGIILFLLLVSPTFRREVKEYFDLNKRSEEARRDKAS